MDLAQQSDLTGNGTGIYAMTDGVTDEEFDQALTEAKDESNLSRRRTSSRTTARRAGVQLRRGDDLGHGG